MGIPRFKFSAWIFWLCLFLIVMLGTIGYLVSGQRVRITNSFTRQLLNEQGVIARAEAANTTLFLQKIGNSVANLAQLSSVENRDVNTPHDLDIFVNQWRYSSIIGGVVLTDKHGVVQLNSNILGTHGIGQSLTDRDFFVWAKTQRGPGKYFINKPVISRLGASKGQVIVVVASPVYQNNTFTGVVAASVILKPLVARFFGLMKVSDKTEVYLIDENGKLLYNNGTKNIIGFNISELFSDDQILSEKIKNALGTTKTGEFQTDKHLVNYAPVLLGNQNWLFIVSSPTQQVVDLMTPFRINQVSIFLLIVFTILLPGIIILRKERAHQENTLSK